MESFERSWPGGFHDSIPKIVTTMALSRKHIKVGDANVFDTETIYARAMGLQSSACDLDTTTLMGHELSPIPTSMFDENGNMRDAKIKSNLKNALKVKVSRRPAEQDVQATFLDGCAVLWVVPWPTFSTVHNYLVRFRSYLDGYLAKSDVYLVFDRYIESSTKEATRSGRDTGASRVYTLRCTARLRPNRPNRHHKQRSIDCSDFSRYCQGPGSCRNRKWFCKQMSRHVYNAGGGRPSDCATSFTCRGWYRPGLCR